MRPFLLGITSAALLAITACGGGKDTPSETTETLAQTEVSVTQPITAAPELAPETQLPAFDLPAQLERELETYIASAQFPDELGQKAPKLAERLKDKTEAEFDQLADHAALSQSESPKSFRQMEIDIVWSETVEAGPLLSLSSMTYVDGGGAHPNHFLSGVIHNVSTNEDVHASDLFADAAAAEALLATRVRDEIAREKAVRFNAGPEEAASLVNEVQDQMPEEGVLSGEIVLVGSSALGKIGGMAFLYEPYDMGAYVEGSYIVTVPQSAFAQLLKPEYSDFFGGDPDDPFAE